jgi:hypothetical protein
MSPTSLAQLLKATHGPSKNLDEKIARKLKVPIKDYSSSVDACLALIDDCVPAAHWHVGRAEDGVSLYATLSNGDRMVESTNTTVPLALLSVLAAFLEGSNGGPGQK